MKKEAKACNIKLSELGKLILKQHEDLTTEAYVIKYGFLQVYFWFRHIRISK